jgi:hypothetical protein
MARPPGHGLRKENAAQRRANIDQATITRSFRSPRSTGLRRRTARPRSKSLEKRFAHPDESEHAKSLIRCHSTTTKLSKIGRGPCEAVPANHVRGHSSRSRKMTRGRTHRPKIGPLNSASSHLAHAYRQPQNPASPMGNRECSSLAKTCQTVRANPSRRNPQVIVAQKLIG